MASRAKPVTAGAAAGSSRSKPREQQGTSAAAAGALVGGSSGGGSRGRRSAAVLHKLQQDARGSSGSSELRLAAAAVGVRWTHPSHFSLWPVAASCFICHFCYWVGSKSWLQLPPLEVSWWQQQQQLSVAAVAAMGWRLPTAPGPSPGCHPGFKVVTGWPVKPRRGC